MDKFLKITYHLGAKKMNAYLQMPSPVYHFLKMEIELCLFEERKQPRCEIRTFWIDEDHDEIEIVNQCDYEIFRSKRAEHQHLHVAPIDLVAEEEQVTPAATTPSTDISNAASNQTKIPPAADSYDFAVHDQVECDACLMAPIIGFRYKCIQCPNYDLCQNCESKHIHSEHMMVRMPTKNCPNVIEAYITGRNSGRRHGKRSKTSLCPFVKNGLSVVIDDDAETTNSPGRQNVEQPSSSNGKERHHGRKHHRRHDRNNFFSHLYEMMHDLAEGGGGAAAAHAMGESATTSSKTTASNEGPQTTTTTTTLSEATAFENVENPIAAAAAAAAAQISAKEAHEKAAKAAEIAAKVAHETALMAVKNFKENMTSAAEGGEKEKEATKEKVDATTSPLDSESQPNTIPVIPSPSLESLAQFLDPQFMKTGVQILNNFSDMFAKMLDPMENSECSNNTIYPNLRKNSTNSTKSSVSSNLSSLGNDMQCDGEKSIQKDETQEKTGSQASSHVEIDDLGEKSLQKDETQEKTGIHASSHVGIDDLGSDSENESGSESFVKVYTPLKENVSTATSDKSATAVSSAQTTPPQSLDKSNIVDFVQLGADLKAHIAEEAVKASIKSGETTTDSVEKAKEALTTITSNAAASAPVVTTTSSISTTTLNTSTRNNSEEKRAIPVYHADQRINNAVIAMMSMGFSNEGAWLTQLLESVNGNISEALDLIPVVQRYGGSR